MAVAMLPFTSKTRLVSHRLLFTKDNSFEVEVQPTLLSSMPQCLLIGSKAPDRTAWLHNAANAICEAPETSTGQQQRIPESLVMAEDMAAEAEAAGESRVWNKLQQLAADFSKAYDGQWLIALVDSGKLVNKHGLTTRLFR